MAWEGGGLVVAGVVGGVGLAVFVDGVAGFVGEEDGDGFGGGGGLLADLVEVVFEVVPEDEFAVVDVVGVVGG